MPKVEAVLKGREQMKNSATPLRHLVFSAVLSVAAGAQEPTFLEGFPDVPVLPEVTENYADRVIFDTPSGTVAETSIRGDIKGREILDLYENKLIPFGWNCQRHPMSLTCTRENNRLLFLDRTPAKKKGLIILRLEPLK